MDYYSTPYLYLISLGIFLTTRPFPVDNYLRYHSEVWHGLLLSRVVWHKIWAPENLNLRGNCLYLWRRLSRAFHGLGAKVGSSYKYYPCFDQHIALGSRVTTRRQSMCSLRKSVEIREKVSGPSTPESNHRADHSPIEWNLVYEEFSQICLQQGHRWYTSQVPCCDEKFW